MGIITLYGGVITAMFDPELEAGINALAESMPEFFAAFGMQNPGVTLLDFLINYLYGFILIVIPFIYIIIMCFKLVAKHIEKGSMSYLLNTNYSRQSIITTQAFVLLLGVLVLVLYPTVLIALLSHFMFEGELDLSKFIAVNVGLLFLECFLAGMCFFFTCLFSELKYSVGLGAGLGFVFFLVQMLSQVNEDIEFLKYFTPLTLFQPKEIAENEQSELLCVGILGVLAVCFFVVGSWGFRKRDLSV